MKLSALFEAEVTQLTQLTRIARSVLANHGLKLKNFSKTIGGKIDVQQPNNKPSKDGFFLYDLIFYSRGEFDLSTLISDDAEGSDEIDDEINNFSSPIKFEVKKVKNMYAHTGILTIEEKK